MELMVDVSPKSLHHLGLTYENVEELLTGALPHAHQLKNENKMNFRSNKLKHVMYFWY